MKSLLIAVAMTGTFAAPVSAHHKYISCDLADCAMTTFSSSWTSGQPLQVIEHQQSPAGQEQQSPE